MALSEVKLADKLEVIGEFQDVQVRVATIIYQDDVELTRAFHRHVIHCQVKVDGEWEDPDVSGEYQNVQDVCNSGIWTEAIKEAYQEAQDALE
tara:strand:- start:98 stop:376 length:279 start_codon:yes stop_codon:yes gene_type:complete